MAHSVALNPSCQGLLIRGEADGYAAARECVLLTLNRYKREDFHATAIFNSAIVLIIDLVEVRIVMFCELDHLVISQLHAVPL